MKFFLRHVILFVSFSSIAQTFTNPILPGAYPDPSICVVDGDFYLVNSSFEYFPGLPIHKSKDLVNWELIGYGLDREDQCNGTNNLVDVQSNGGIHAPTIRYHEGIFYIITTNIYKKCLHDDVWWAHECPHYFVHRPDCWFHCIGSLYLARNLSTPNSPSPCSCEWATQENTQRKS